MWVNEVTMWYWGLFGECIWCGGGFWGTEKRSTNDFGNGPETLLLKLLPLGHQCCLVSSFFYSSIGANQGRGKLLKRFWRHWKGFWTSLTNLAIITSHIMRPTTVKPSRGERILLSFKHCHALPTTTSTDYHQPPKTPPELHLYTRETSHRTQTALDIMFATLPRLYHRHHLST